MAGAPVEARVGTGPAEGRRERKKREMRRRIYRAAFDLFLEKGFDATTVEEIAERADVAKGTVFNYFPRKESFLAALLEERLTQLEEELGPPETWRGTARQKLRRVFLKLAELSERSPDLSRLIFLESLKRMFCPVTEEGETIREFEGITRSILSAARETGEIRGDVEIEDAASLIEAAYFSALLTWLTRGGSGERFRVEVSAKLDIIFNGLAAGRGSGGGSRAMGNVLRILGAAAAIALAAPARGAGSPAGPPSDPPDTLDLTLEAAVARALRVSEEVGRARAEFAQAEAQVRQAVAGALPQVSGTLVYNRAIRTIFDAFQGPPPVVDSLIPPAFDPDRPPEERFRILSGLMAQDFVSALFEGLPFGRRNTYIATIRFSQPLYVGGKVGAALRAAEHFRAAARHRLAEAQADVALQVRRAYFRGILAQRLVEIAEESRRLAEAHLHQVELFHRAGTASEFDLLRARVERENRDPAVVQARSALTLALLDLRRLANIPADVPIRLVTPLEPVIDDVDREALARAVLDRPALQAAEEMVAVQREAVRIAKGDRLPTLSLSGTFGFQAFPDDPVPPSSYDEWRKDWAAALSLSIPIFDGLRTRGRIDQAEAQLRLARLQTDQLREGLELEFAAALAEFDAARAQIEARRQTVAQARRALDLAELRFANGLSTQLEVSDAALLLEQARVNEVSALHDYVEALARLERLAGGRIRLVAPRLRQVRATESGAAAGGTDTTSEGHDR